jgi:thiol-disulfide isomerase/thioredoxin
MIRFAVSSCLALAVCGWLAFVPSARAEDRNADQIIKEINAVEMPKPDPAMRNNRQAANKFMEERKKALIKRAELTGELFKVAPDRQELVELLPQRWNVLLLSGKADAKALNKELTEVATTSKNAKLRVDASYWKAVTALQSRESTDTVLAATEEFMKAAPKDERGAILMYSVANQLDDTEKQTALFKRLAHDYPESRVATMVKGTLKRLESVGKPFDLEFTDAIKGSTVSIKGLKGKVVVVDFWATWCGPCVDELPNMKKLYAEYKDKGVEFIGVSLDQPKEQGGLDKLKDFVSKNEIGWPQYYQGKGWESEFSGSWGINSIPAVFIVDAQGKLHSVNARGKLDTLIPELLKKASAKTDAGAGGN